MVCSANLRPVWGAFVSMLVANSMPETSGFSFSWAWRVKTRNPHCESDFVTSGVAEGVEVGLGVARRSGVMTATRRI